MRDVPEFVVQRLDRIALGDGDDRRERLVAGTERGDVGLQHRSRQSVPALLRCHTDCQDLAARAQFRCGRNHRSPPARPARSPR